MLFERVRFEEFRVGGLMRGSGVRSLGLRASVGRGSGAQE